MEPQLDFAALQPGKPASDAIRQAAADARIGPEDGATLHLTGAAPVNDEQFATLSSGAALNGIGTAAAVLLILWLALRSGRIVLEVVLNLVVGLALTAAAGLLTIDAPAPDRDSAANQREQRTWRRSHSSGWGTWARRWRPTCSAPGIPSEAMT